MQFAIFFYTESKCNSQQKKFSSSANSTTHAITIPIFKVFIFQPLKIFLALLRSAL